MASISDKPSRARPIQAMASMGKVFFPRNARWKAELLIQLLRFPAAKHDDGVDVMSLFGRGMEFIRGPKKRNDLKIARTAGSGMGWMG
jgi:phage terminase large subunit-like protein